MPTVLVTGATGFVGRRLVRSLVASGVEVRAASRRPAARQPVSPGVTWVTLDVDRPQTLGPAMEGCSAAYFLVHGMGRTAGYEERERRAAASFAEAAARAGLERLIYLGGIAPAGVPSRHLRSRLTTGEVLRAGRVPVFELRAGMIIGPGSESWRIVRDLATRLPAMVLPRWLRSRSQPVDIGDVLAALGRALELPLSDAGVYDLPGPELLSAREIIARVARLHGTNPVLFDVPLVTPRLSAVWIRLVTRAHGAIAGELVEGLRSDLLSTGRPFWPHLEGRVLVPFDVAVRRALAEEAPALRLRSLALEALAYLVSRKAAAT